MLALIEDKNCFRLMMNICSDIILLTDIMNGKICIIFCSHIYIFELLTIAILHVISYVLSHTNSVLLFCQYL